jgi:hypothetical protein
MTSMETICSRLIAIALLPIAAGLGLAPTAIASTVPGTAAIYDAGAAPVGSLYCVQVDEVISKIPIIGGINRAFNGTAYVAGINIVGIPRSATYREVAGRYGASLLDGTPRFNQSFRGTLDEFGGYATAKPFQIGNSEGGATVFMSGRRFTTGNAGVAFRPEPTNSPTGNEPVVEVNCLTEASFDQLDLQELNQLAKAIETFLILLTGKRVRVRI